MHIPYACIIINRTLKYIIKMTGPEKSDLENEA